jgi:hypothetical protein
MEKILKNYLFILLLLAGSSAFAQTFSKKYDLKDIVIISKAYNYYLLHDQLNIDNPVAVIEYINENEIAIHFKSGDIDFTYDGSKPGNNFFKVTLLKKNGEWIPNKITGVR